MNGSPEARPVVGRIREAFAPRANVRRLFERPHMHLAFVDGLRALSVLWLMAFHAVLFLGKFESYEQIEASARTPLGYLALQGELAVDGFFVISGFLIGRLVMRELAERGRLALGRFYMRRTLRLMPAYMAMLLLAAPLLPLNAAMAWTNLLYVNNFVPYAQSFASWTWSLAIEEQFYLVLPLFWLLVRPLGRWRLALLVALMALGVFVRWQVMAAHGLSGESLPYSPPWFNSGRIDSVFVAVWDTIYIKPHTRFGSLLAGVAAAYLVLHTGLVARLQAHRGWATGLLALGLLAVVWPLGVARISTPAFDPSWWNLAPTAKSLYLASFHSVFALGVASVLLACFVETGPAGWVRRFLVARVWYPLAQLSYSAFLLNPIGYGLVYALAAPHFGVSMANVWGYYGVGTLFSLWLAMGLYLIVERPLMTLRD